jgi:hypothetical protein
LHGVAECDADRARTRRHPHPEEIHDVKFMLMMHCPANVAEELAAWPPADFGAHIEFMIELAKDLAASGELVLAEGLEMPDKAKLVVATRPDRPSVTDGPFAESKEFLAGFWLVDVPSAERAYEIAARASSAPGPGGKPMGIPIEVRQVGVAPEV